MREEAYSEPIREGSKQVGVEALASLSKNQLFHFKRNNSPYYILKAIELFHNEYKITQLNNNNYNTELFQFDYNNFKKLIGYIYSNNNSYRILNYFFENGAATAVTLIKRLNLNEMTCYHILKNFVNSGILIESRTVKRPKGAKGGPKAVIYTTPETTPEQIVRAQELNEKLINPRFVSCEQFAQQIIDEWFILKSHEGIDWGVLIAFTKGFGVTGTDVIPFAELIASILRQQGHKVWRTGA